MDGRRLLQIYVNEEEEAGIYALFGFNNWPIQERFEDSPDEINTGDDLVSPDPNEEECRHCFSRPCVTNLRFRQNWWCVEQQAPSVGAHTDRKEKYKNFWTMLYHRNVWKDPRYIEKKKLALERDPSRKKYEWLRKGNKRDIMPNCILQLVRDWIPNLPGVPYMGHLWE